MGSVGLNSLVGAATAAVLAFFVPEPVAADFFCNVDLDLVITNDLDVAGLAFVLVELGLFTVDVVAVAFLDVVAVGL